MKTSERNPSTLPKISAVIAFAVATILLGALVLWILPAVLTRNVTSGELTDAERLKAVNDVRVTVLSFVVAVGAGGTLWFTSRTYLLNREGQMAQRYASAVGLLRDDDRSVRLGGVYALERIGLADRERPAVIAVLGAFIRDCSRHKEREWPHELDIDVRAAIGAANRLSPDGMINVRGANLTDAELTDGERAQMRAGGATGLDGDSARS